MEKKAGITSIVGVAVAALGGALRLPTLGLVGLIVLGAGVFCWGLSGVLGGRISFSRPGTRYSESFYGLAARAWGALLCLAGAAMASAGFLTFVIPDVSFAEVAASPSAVGFGMVLGGLAGMLYAATLILGRAEDGGSWARRALRLPRRLLGGFVLLACAALAVVGAVRVAAPRAYEAAVRSISGRLPGAPR